jgi:hypothetical protein
MALCLVADFDALLTSKVNDNVMARAGDGRVTAKFTRRGIQRRREHRSDTC